MTNRQSDEDALALIIRRARAEWLERDGDFDHYLARIISDHSPEVNRLKREIAMLRGDSARTQRVGYRCVHGCFNCWTMCECECHIHA